MSETHDFTVALAGNANVGKSVIFNQLTGLNQVVGNWPGKTVERAEGTLHFEGYTIKILDLPGIYSLSTFSLEEIVARDYIAVERPDVIVNVVDASAIERNLYFTIQLLELEAPVVMALNQVDFAAKKGINVDEKKLSRALGIPVVPTVAVTGAGIRELMSVVVKLAEGRVKRKPLEIRYGREVEERLEKLETEIRDKFPELSAKYPPRWLAVKLMERDDDITEKVQGHRHGKAILSLTDKLAAEIEQIHGEASPVVVVSERYRIASATSREAERLVLPPRQLLEEKLDAITTHNVLGYPILICVMALTFSIIFVGGDLTVSYLESLFDEILIPAVVSYLEFFLSPMVVKLISNGVLTGIAAGVTIALPYIIPFYIILSIMEDSGYLPRAAFLVDNLMHRIGLHGKAFIPLILGYGCSVPACVGCRIMETDRERFLAGFLAIIIPCAARTVIILGLVGRYIGIPAALGIYLFDLTLVFILGRLAYRALPGTPVGLIMEMPPYKIPSMNVVLKKTWARTKDFIYVAFPLIIAGSFILELLKITGLIWPLADLMAPIVSGWLGLPPISGVPLIFGVLRKELTLILLSELAGTLNFNEILTPEQLIVFSLVTMIYVPCIATIAALVREFGWQRALTVTIFYFLLALFVGGIAHKLLAYLWVKPLIP